MLWHQVDRKFIVVTSGRLLLIFDQHAADERVRLEALTKLVLDARGSQVQAADVIYHGSPWSPTSIRNLQPQYFSEANLTTRSAVLNRSGFEFKNRAALDSLELADPQVESAGMQVLIFTCSVQ